MVYREAPLATDRSILVVAVGGLVYGWDRETGAERWSNPLGGGDNAEVFLAMKHGLLIACSNGARVHRLDYQTGKTLWSRGIGSAMALTRATVLIEPDCIVVAKNGAVACLDHDGNVRWSKGMPLVPDSTGRAALGFPGNVALADG